MIRTLSNVKRPFMFEKSNPCAFTRSLLGVLRFGSIHKEGEDFTGCIDFTQHRQNSADVFADHIFRFSNLR